MNIDDLKNKLSSIGCLDHRHYLDEAFSRNLGLLSLGEQLELASKRVAIPGLGGVGGVHLITLTRTGIGNFNIADLDEFELGNTNRQYGANVETIGCSKIDVMARQAQSINPYLQINKFSRGITADNIDDFLNDVDLVVDSMDAFEFDTRRLIFNEARKRKIPVITAGPLGFSSAFLVFDPKSPMGFDDYFHVKDSDSMEHKLASFIVGLSPNLGFTKYMAPVNARKRKAASLGLACQLCAGIAASEAVRILLKRGKSLSVPHYARFDPYTRRYIKGFMPFGNRNPLQRLKIALVKKKLGGVQVKFAENVPPLPVIGDGDLSEEVFRFLVDAGRMAPSGDNLQPWRFAIDGQSLVVKGLDKADVSPYNFQHRATAMSLGAVVENIVTAAAHIGLKAEPRFKSSAGDVPEVRLVFAKEEIVPDFPVPTLWERTTNRFPYEQRPLLATAEKMLLRTIESVPGMTGCFLKEEVRIGQFCRLNTQVDRWRVENQSLHETLHGSIRWTDKHAERVRTGMPRGTLGVGLIYQAGFLASRNWWVADYLNRLGMSKVTARMISSVITRSSAIGIIAARGSRPEDLFDAGRAFQRVWLKATELGLSFQPIAPIPLSAFMDRNEFEQLAPGKQSELQEVLTQLYSLIPEIDWTKYQPAMFYRVGYGPLLTTHAPRQAVEQLLE